MIHLHKVKDINWVNKKIAIVGYGKSGQAVAKLCKELGCKVFISDNGNKNIPTSEFEYELGCHTNKIIESELIIISPGVPTKKGILKECIDNNMPIVSEIEFASWFTSSPIIAITGSNGKTTTTSLLYEILSNANIDVLLGGNIGIPFSENIIKEKKSNLKNCVHLLEISSFQMEYVYNFSPLISCILNISEDHMDRYSSMQDYIDAKMNIAQNLVEPAWLVYNADDSVLSTSLKNRHRTKLFSLSSNMQAHYQLKNGSIYNNQDNNNLIDLNTIKLCGNHNLQNILAAATISYLFNISDEVISYSISKFEPLPHRLELVRDVNGIKFVNDSKATNIESVRMAIQAYNNIILILGGQLKGDTDFTELIPIMANKVNTIICYGESSQVIRNQLKSNFTIETFPKFDVAVYKAISLLEYHECILLSPGCASFDQFDNYNSRGDRFKQIINEYNFEIN